MNDKELNALISLSEDPDNKVFDSVKYRFLELVRYCQNFKMLGKATLTV